MKQNKKVSQDKKVPMDAATEKTKNKSSIREEDKNEVLSSREEENKSEVREDRAKRNVNSKPAKPAEIISSKQVKAPGRR